MKREPKTKKPTKLEELTHAVERDNSFHSSARLESKLRVLACEMNELDREIVSLSAAVTNAKERRTRLEATSRGLGRVLDKRGICS